MNWLKTTVVLVCMWGFVFAACGDNGVRAFGQSGSAKKAVGSEDFLVTILMDAQKLAKIKQRIKENDPALKPAMDQLIADAEAALLEGPYTVTDKKKVAPSGDKHDYASYSRYWWPDPDKADGLPYIRKDGETNPASQGLEESDRQRIEVVGTHTEALGIAYYLTGEEKYAKKAAEILRVWFLDPATRMNPNVNHGQVRLGHNTGTKGGVLDGRMMMRALEGGNLLAGSSALSDTEREGLKAWAGEYFNWLKTGKHAVDEAASTNNHGTFFDAQAMYFALYSGNKEETARIAKEAIEKRVLSQIEEDGSMPEELRRTRPQFYSNYCLHAHFIVALLAEKVDVDLWNAGDGRLRAAVDYLAPYSDPSVAWPHDTIKENDRMNMFPILKMADLKYPDGNYLKMTEKLPLEERQIRRENLAFPLMR